jgi:hypothetical protein
MIIYQLTMLFWQICLITFLHQMQCFTHAGDNQVPIQATVAWDLTLSAPVLMFMAPVGAFIVFGIK